MTGQSLSKFKRTAVDISRFRQVIGVLFDEGFSFFADELRLRGVVPLRSRLWRRVRRGGQAVGLMKDDLPNEVRLQRAFERLGPTFMKFGQLLSVRSDILPPEYIRELSKLQDHGPELLPGLAEKVVEDQLGTAIENIFSEFEERPIAAASLSQVHRARLKDGRLVAVKVRRPNIEKIVKSDLQALTYIAQALEKHLPMARRFHPIKLTREFSAWTMRELDFEIEGANMDIFRANFADVPEVVIPVVHWDFVGPEVLVTDFIEGLKVDDPVGLDKAGVDRHELARIGLKFGIRQFLLDGFFHGDPHPGNMAVLPAVKNSANESAVGLRLGLYDFGMIGRLPEKFRFELIGCFVCYLDRDADGYIKHILDMSEVEEGGDIAAFRDEAANIVATVIHKPTEKKGMARAFFRVLMSGARYGVIFPSDLILLAKSFVTIENNGLALWPDIDFEVELKPYLAEIVRREFSPKRAIDDLKSSAFDTLYFARHLPERTQALFERLDRGEFGVKLDFQELRDLKSEFDRQNDVRVLALLAVSLLITAAMIMRLDARIVATGLPLGEIGFVVALIMVIWMFFLIKKKP